MPVSHEGRMYKHADCDVPLTRVLTTGPRIGDVPVDHLIPWREREPSCRYPPQWIFLLVPRHHNCSGVGHGVRGP